MTQHQIPTYKDLLWPTLKALEDRGGSASIQELLEQVAADLALPNLDVTKVDQGERHLSTVDVDYIEGRANVPCIHRS